VNQLQGTVPTSLTALFPLSSATWSSNCLTGISAPHVDCGMPERAALVDLFTSTSGPSWTQSTLWLSSASPCTWLGVSCASGVVTALQLGENGLAGTIPSTISALSGLLTLRLFGNALTGTLPSSIGSLTRLQYEHC
jgi:hypothetical protein